MTLDDLARHAVARRVHEPGCTGPLKCGGWYRCRACGKRCGWCRGESWDIETCPECWQGPPQPVPALRYAALTGVVGRDAAGRFTVQLEGAP